MSDIKTNDRVRVTKRSGDEGLEGTVIQVMDLPGRSKTFVVQFGYHYDTFDADELEVIDEPLKLAEPVIGEQIEFEEIRAGDKIRTVREFEQGFVLTTEGVAHRTRKSDGAWVTTGDSVAHCVASKDTGACIKQTHILVERPEPNDHIVVSTWTLSGVTNVEVLTAKTKTECEALAVTWNNAKHGPVGDRKIYRAVKVA